MKKITAALLFLVVVFLSFSTAMADTKQGTEDPEPRNIKVIIDGKEVALKDKKGEPAEVYIKDGVVYIPIGLISDELGYQSNWDEKKGVLTLTGNSNKKSAKKLKENAWNLTDEAYYSYEGQYVSKQNEYYIYDESYKGITDDGYVCFKLYGGYQGPKYGGDDSISVASFKVECSVPEESYAPGETAKLTLRCETDNSYGEEQYSPGQVYFSKGNGKKTGDKFFGWSDGYFSDKDGEEWSHKWNTSTELFGKFPENPEDGDQIAIIFYVPVGYDSWSMDYENDYGGSMFYEWIYTYKAAK